METLPPEVCTQHINIYIILGIGTLRIRTNSIPIV